VSDKIVPVISTYSQVNGAVNSIFNQEKVLRDYFDVLAFRTFPNTFFNDLAQISRVANECDFLIVDVGKNLPNPDDEDLIDIIEKLDIFDKCHVVIVRSAISDEITNVGLDHGKIVRQIDNSLLLTYRRIGGNSFGDYVGIKKDNITKGGGISPSFIYYNPIENKFYGFRGTLNSSGKSNQELIEFETIIVPDVMDCNTTKGLQNSYPQFLAGN
jgi:hypothetical protein